MGAGQVHRAAAGGERVRDSVLVAVGLRAGLEREITTRMALDELLACTVCFWLDSATAIIREAQSMLAAALDAYIAAREVA